MRARTVVCMCALSLFVSAAGVFAAPGAPDTAVRAQDSVHQKWWAQLNLTQDQKAKLKALRGGAKDFRKANFDKMKALLDKSKEELLKSAPNKAVLYGYAKEIGDLHKAISEHMADQMLKMKTILTKEQFQKFLNRDFQQGMGRPGAHLGEGPHHPHDGPPPGDLDD
jgi:Spy/CpxP family protein refolding chaperone